MAFHCLHYNKKFKLPHGFYHYSVGISCFSHTRLLIVSRRSCVLSLCLFFMLFPLLGVVFLLPLPTGKILFLPPPFPDRINHSCLWASHNTLCISLLQYLSYCFIVVSLCTSLSCYRF